MRKVRWYVIAGFLGLPLLLYTWLFVFPSLQALYLSLTDWSGMVMRHSFIGLDNYVRLFQDKYFITALGNSMVYLFGGGIVIFLISLLFTFCLTVIGMKRKRFVTNLFYFPNMVSSSAVALLWIFILSPGFGLLPNLFMQLGLRDLAFYPWLGNRWGAMMAFILIATWSGVGFYLLVFVSGLDKIPATLMDAAKTDGATTRQMFFKISMPLLKDIIIINLTLWVINSIKFFEIPWAMTEGAPANQTHTLATYQYMSAFGTKYNSVNAYGYASAIAVVMVLLIFLGTVIIRRFEDKEPMEF